MVTRLKAAGYDDPYGTANYKGLTLNEFAKMVFPDLYSSAKNPSIIAEEHVIGSDGKEVRGHTQGNYLMDGQNCASVGKDGALVDPIKISSTLNSRYYDLAEAVAHELYHAIDHVSGNYLNWINKGGLSYANLKSELNAYTSTNNLMFPQTEFNLKSIQSNFLHIINFQSKVNFYKF